MPSTRYGLRARLLARFMAKSGPRYENLVAERKQLLFAEARGRVLEIGAGTGPNLRFLNVVDSYLASEPNPFMHPYLLAEIEKQRVEGRVDSRPAELLLAETPEASFDTVVCTLVLCSVADPARMLALIRRVLCPGGKVLLLEHLGAPKGTALCACQHFLRPFFWYLGDGCRPIRRTTQMVATTGFSRTELEEFRLPLGPIAPHLCGWAQK